MMTNRTWPLIIVAIILAVFLPAFSAEICKVDDSLMIEGLRHITQWSFGDIFLPRAAGGLYYRPLTMLTFFVDKTFFGLSPFSLHIENILVHLANTLLVFFITRSLLARNGSLVSSGSAFIGSLLFGIHPLVTESVNWISGRTDLLMGFFLLTSTLLLVQYRATGRRYLPWLAAISFLCALLAKELAIAFLPGYFLILYAQTQTEETRHHPPSSLRKKLLIAGTVTLLVIGTFFLLRSIAFTSNSSRIGVTLQYMHINPSHSFFLFLRAIGFYLKKLLIPWPLNFAIEDIDPLYELAAIPLTALCLYIAMRRTIVTAIFTTGLLLFTPALLIGLNQIAWTPYAERYLYSTTAFVSIAAVVSGSSYLRFPLTKAWRLGLISLILGIFAISTFQRNLTWQTNRRILADTAQKSPLCQRVQWLYGASLIEAGDYPQALIYTQRAVALTASPLIYDPIPGNNLGYILYHLGRIPEAIVQYETVIKKSSDSSPEAQEGLIECYSLLINQTTDDGQKREYLKVLRSHGDRLFALHPDPLVYYNLGKLAQANREYGEARKFFTQAASLMPEGHADLPLTRQLLQQ